MGVHPVSFWLVVLCSFCAGLLLVAESKSGADGSWLSDSARGSTNSVHYDVAGFWLMILMVFSSASAGHDVVNVGGIISITENKAAVLA